jgi:hypothetical protein
MHARQEFREPIISKKMHRWLMIAKYPLVNPKCPPARARKNFWRLCARYPEIMQKLGLDEVSVYR